MKVLVVQHEDECPPARFGAWLTEAGADLDIRRPYAGEALPQNLDAHDGLLILGGAMSAVGDSPWLPATKALAREAVRDEVPLLGICLGHQIIADALGGTVAPNPNGTQRGLLDHDWTQAADDDPLYASKPPRAAHWNDDIVTVAPAGAMLLARAPGGEVQALRYGAKAHGLQSHPEIDERILATWATQDDVDVTEFRAVMAAADDALVAAWKPVAVAFAGMRRG